MNSKNKNCLICGSEKLKQLSGYYERHELVACENCGFVFMERIPTLDELNAYYSKYSYSESDYMSPITIRIYNLWLDEFERYRKNNKILDVGCGRGWFLQEAKKRGWEVYGTEFSEAAIELCESEGIKMTGGQLTSDSFHAEEFDVITSIEVIEHINNPKEEIAYIHKFLRKGGMFYCTTPNFNSYLRFYLKADYDIIKYPEHLSFYTRATLKRLLNKQGFKTKKVLTTGISVTRLNVVKKPSNEPWDLKESDDEKLRRRIDGKWYMEYLKILINKFLTIFGIGMSLKGYFIKK